VVVNSIREGKNKNGKWEQETEILTGGAAVFTVDAGRDDWQLPARLGGGPEMVHYACNGIKNIIFRI